MTSAAEEIIMTEDRNGMNSLNKEAVDILFRLNWVIRISRLYEPDKLLFTRQVKILHHMLKKAIQEFEEASFKLRRYSLYFNELKLKFSFSNSFLLDFMVREFQKKEIGVIRFRSDLDVKELTSFILLYAKEPSSHANSPEDFQKILEASGVEHILLEKASSLGQIEGRKNDIMKTYFLGILHLKEIFEHYQKEKRIPLVTTRKLMHELFNTVEENEAFIHGLTTIKNIDAYIFNHSVNVCLLAICLGKKLGLERDEIDDLAIGAFFHDYGKMDIPENILLKPGKLAETERKIIEHHPHYGAEKLIRMKTTGNIPLRAINVALEHHTQEGQGGYPRYAKKKNINLFSKIVKVIDVFDALTTKRPYRNRDFTREEALRMMLEKSGEEFDPLILKAFINIMGAYPVGSLVLLNTGEIGIVYEPHPHPAYLLRPKIKVITDEEGNKTEGQLVDLSEKNPETLQFQRTIVRILDPAKYGITIPDYFVADAVASR